jgi:hypothetical protein
MHATQEHSVVNSHHVGHSFNRALFLKMLGKSTKEAFSFLWIFLKVVYISFYVLWGFVSKLEQVAWLLKKITMPLLIYIIGTYLTLLSYYIVIPLIFIPKRYSLPIVGIASILSFFMVFAI